MRVAGALLPSSRAYRSQRLQMRYLDWGDPAAPPLLLLHGMRSHARSWDALASILCQDWRVIVPDLRGHGDSAWSPEGNYSLWAFLCDLVQLVQQESLPSAAIVGHSLGGYLGLRFAALYPQRVTQIVAIEGLGLAPGQDPARIDACVRDWIDERQTLMTRPARRYGSMQEALTHLRARSERLSAEAAWQFTTSGLARNEDGTFSWKFDPALRPMRPQPPEDLSPAQQHALWSGIRCPTLLVWGAASHHTNPALDGRLQLFRNARVATVADATHWVPQEQPEALLDVLRGFLRKQPEIEIRSAEAGPVRDGR